MDFKIFYFPSNLNKLSMKYQFYPKTTKIDAFEQKKKHVTTPIITDSKHLDRLLKLQPMT